ncbi:ABC transporter permease [Atopococcus tabaci]|uniref:ABC transporter permease n=1 Tax=Atopococcus tabaci TaxID=269774 RepID=UPI00240A11DB|nr:ABC transporter permease [Atopococcus tabaci]
MKSNFFSKMAWRNIQSNRQLYYPYIASSVIAVAMFMMMASLLTNDFVRERSSTLPQLFGMGVFVIALFSLVFIFYANSFLMKRRKKELGLYSILGLEKKHVARVLGMETVLVGGFSLLAGVSIGILFGQLSFLFLNYLLQLPVAMEYSLSWISVGITVALFAGIFFMTMVYNIAQITLANPIRLLKGSREGEKEPKSSPILMLIGVVSLGAGYAMSLTIEDPISAITQFFTAVLLVVIGTYLLFTAGSVIVLKALKKNKRFYYQPGPFISVSGMLYRMKQHAVGLANISILSVMVIIAVSTTVTLFVGTEETLENRFPEENNVTLFAPDEMTGEELKANAGELYGKISDRTADAGIQMKNQTGYRYVSLVGNLEGSQFKLREMGYGGEMPLMTLLIPLEDYNQAAGESLSLKENELLVRAAGIDYEPDSLTIGGNTFDVTELEEMPYFMDANVYLVDTLILIAPDSQTIDEIVAHYQQQSETINPYWKAELFWATDATEGETIAYADMIEDLSDNHGMEIGIGYESRDASRQEWYSINGGFLFLGIFLGGLFTIGAMLITYFKQVSEGYDDRERVQIMQKVGLDKETTRQATRSQIVWMFSMPILTAALHTAFAFPIIQKMLVLFGITSKGLLIACTVGVVLAFAFVYWVIYRITSKVYLNIVE